MPFGILDIADIDQDTHFAFQNKQRQAPRDDI